MAKRTELILAALLGVVVTCPLPPAPCPFGWAEDVKLGYVDLGKVFDHYERTKQSEAVLEQKGQQKEAEVESRLNELRKMRQGLDLLSDAAREAKARDLEARTDELKRFETHTRRDLAVERDRVAQEILEEIRRTVRGYAAANGFSLVLDDRSLLYGQEVYDLTQEILQQLNDRFAKRGQRAAR